MRPRTGCRTAAERSVTTRSRNPAARKRGARPGSVMATFRGSNSFRTPLPISGAATRPARAMAQNRIATLCAFSAASTSSLQRPGACRSASTDRRACVISLQTRAARFALVTLLRPAPGVGRLPRLWYRLGTFGRQIGDQRPHRVRRHRRRQLQHDCPTAGLVCRCDLSDREQHRDYAGANEHQPICTRIVRSHPSHLRHPRALETRSCPNKFSLHEFVEVQMHAHPREIRLPRRRRLFCRHDRRSRHG